MVTLSLFLDYYNQRLTHESLRISCPDCLLANRTQTKSLKLCRLTILYKTPIFKISSQEYLRTHSSFSISNLPLTNFVSIISFYEISIFIPKIAKRRNFVLTKIQKSIKTEIRIIGNIYKLGGFLIYSF